MTRQVILRQAREWMIPFLISLAFFLVLRFVIFIGYVPTNSMEPTIQSGSIIVGHRWYQELEVGDIIVFRLERSFTVKRIAAIEGETVIANGKTVTVPEDTYYVLGDNANTSYDSRFYDNPFIKAEDVIAVVW